MGGQGRTVATGGAVHGPASICEVHHDHVHSSIRTAMRAGARKRQRDYLTDILSGPDTTYRSELIEATSGIR